MAKIGTELFSSYLEVRQADTLAQSTYQREEKLENIQEITRLYEEITEAGVSLGMLAVNGSDLIAAGMKPGKEIGKKLNEFLELVLEEPELNTKEELLGRL